MRECIFADMIAVIDILKSKLYFFKDKLISSLSDCSANCTGELKQILQAFQETVETDRDITFEKLQERIPKLSLKENEHNAICQFLAGLGRSDRENQSEYLSNYIYTFRQFKEDALAERKKFASMYIKLGFSAGLLICILLV